MKLAAVQKYLLTFLMTILLVPQLAIMPVYADDDPNKSVSDYWGTETVKDNDADKKSDTEQLDLETDTDVPIADPSSDGKAVGSSVGDYIKVMVALLFVVGLLYGLLKFVNRKNRLYDKNRYMINIGGLSLGQHKSIQLVVIGDSYYLVGVGDDVSLLKEITDPEEIDKLVDFYKGDDLEVAKGMLSRILDKLTGTSKKAPTSSSGESADFGNLFQSKLDEMKEERQRHISRLTEKERNHDE